MRTTSRPSEIRRLAAPALRLLDGAWQRMHWWIATMAVLYIFSGITVVKPDEVAVVLRWGRLVGNIPALQQHGPGLLLAFPRPMDQVVRVPVKHVWEVRVTDLTTIEDEDIAATSLDPLTQGYAVTGDHNVVHVDIVARYRVRDPAEWAFYGPKSEDVLRVEVTTAMTQALGGTMVDRVLSDGRKDLIVAATARAQAGLDAAHSGLELSSLELTRLSPPAALASAFDAVQSAYIGAETAKKSAQAYAETVVTQAQASADAAVQQAHGQADSDLATARGDTESFLALNREYRENPVVVRERLYRDAVDRAIGNARRVEWVPPPIGNRYNNFRISIPSDIAGVGTNPSPSADEDEEEEPSPAPPQPPPPKP